MNKFEPSVYQIDSTHGRMFLYIRQILEKGQLPNLGEHWVGPGDDPYTSVLARIKSGMGKEWTRYSQIAPVEQEDQFGLVKIWTMVDVTDWAKQNCPENLKPSGGVDNKIRDQFFHNNTHGEFHDMDPQEMIATLTKCLGQHFKPLTLEINNQVVVDKLVEAVNWLLQGFKIIACDLCPRFGKTLWTMLVAHFAGKRDVVVASYVHTVWGSYQSQVVQYSIFKNWTLIDMRKDYRILHKKAMQEGKKVIWFFPLTKSPDQHERSDYLFAYVKDPLWVVEEADIGTHTPKVLPILQKAVGGNAVLIESGTNMARAIKGWRYDKMMRVSYFELLVKQKETNV